MGAGVESGGGVGKGIGLSPPVLLPLAAERLVPVFQVAPLAAERALHIDRKRLRRAEPPPQTCQSSMLTKRRPKHCPFSADPRPAE